MICVDSNTIIYLGNGTLSKDILNNQSEVACSVITKIEVLGYHLITTTELHSLEFMLSNIQVLPLNRDIVDIAIKIKQSKKISLGDSVIGATAIYYDIELWTANIKDFSGIDDLRIVNVLKLK